MLGHVVNKSGIRVDLEKIRKMGERKIPENLTELCSFCSACSYYRRAIQGYTELAAPLYKLMRKYQEFKWTDV